MGSEGTVRGVNYNLLVPPPLADRLRQLREIVGYPQTLRPYALTLLERAIRAEEERLNVGRPAA